MKVHTLEAKTIKVRSLAWTADSIEALLPNPDLLEEEVEEGLKEVDEVITKTADPKTKM